MFLIFFNNFYLFLGYIEKPYDCERCGRSYKVYRSLWRHRKYECGVQPQFVCPDANCNHRSKLKMHMKTHVMCKHRNIDYNFQFNCNTHRYSHSLKKQNCAINEVSNIIYCIYTFIKHRKVVEIYTPSYKSVKVFR